MLRMAFNNSNKVTVFASEILTLLHMSLLFSQSGRHALLHANHSKNLIAWKYGKSTKTYSNSHMTALVHLVLIKAVRFFFILEDNTVFVAAIMYNTCHVDRMSIRSSFYKRNARGMYWLNAKNQIRRVRIV